MARDAIATALIAVALPLAALPAGCSNRPDGIDVQFVSDYPLAHPEPPSPPEQSDSAPEAIEVARLAGDRLYLLSKRGELMVLDVAQPDDPAVMGTLRFDAKPVELWIQDEVLLVLYTSFGEFIEDTEGDYHYRVNSRLLSIDAADPAALDVVGRHEIPGTVTTASRAGGRLYVGAHEDGVCWGCGDSPATVVHSFEISDFAQPQRLSPLETVLEPAHRAPRAIAFGAGRLYLATPTDAETGTTRSAIAVLSIDEEDGSLAPLATLTAAGDVRDGAQLAEHEGVLSVVSQRDRFGESGPITLETFRVSQDGVEPLGSIEAPLPSGARPTGVHMDPERACVYTESDGPIGSIVVFDTSDPTMLRSGGLLEVPGSVEQVDTHEQQLLALGFAEEDERPLSLSLFDISDVSAMFLVERARYATGQVERFSLLADEGLVLQPLGSRTTSACQAMDGGVQLLSLEPGGLTERGFAPQRDASRLGVVRGDRLLAISDSRLSSFNIFDWDEPIDTATIRLRHEVERTIVVGERLARLNFGPTREGGGTTLTVGPLDNTAQLESLSELDLDAELELDDFIGSCQESPLRDALLFAGEQHLYLLFSTGGPETTLATIDLGDPGAPSVVNTLRLAFALGQSTFELAGAAPQGQAAVKVGQALVLHRGERDATARAGLQSRAHFEVVDLSRPDAPRHVASVERERAAGHAALRLLDGVATSASIQEVDELGGQVAYFFERLNVVDPANPRALSPINVPGLPIAFNAAAGRLITSNIEVAERALPREDCDGLRDAYAYRDNTGGCILVRRDLALMAVGGTRAIEVGRQGVAQTSELVASRRRVFVEIAQAQRASEGNGSGVEHSLLTFTGLDSGELRQASRYELGELDLDLPSSRVDGVRLVAPIGGAGLAVFDTNVATNPALTIHAFGHCRTLELTDVTAYCSLGFGGVQGVALQ